MYAHVYLIYRSNILIFQSYVSLPEATSILFSVSVSDLPPVKSYHLSWPLWPWLNQFNAAWMVVLSLVWLKLVGEKDGHKNLTYPVS